MGISPYNGQKAAVYGTHRSAASPTGRIMPVGGYRAVTHSGYLAQVNVAMRQRVIALFGAPRAGVMLEGLTYLLEVYRRHPEAARTRVKVLSGGRVGVWIGHQGQVV